MDSIKLDYIVIEEGEIDFFNFDWFMREGQTYHAGKNVDDCWAGFMYDEMEIPVTYMHSGVPGNSMYEEFMQRYVQIAWIADILNKEMGQIVMDMYYGVNYMTLDLIVPDRLSAEQHNVILTGLLDKKRRDMA